MSPLAVLRGGTPPRVTVTVAAAGEPATREGWIEELRADGGTVVVDLLLDGRGELASATLPTLEADWLDLRVGDIVRVRA